MVYKVEVSYDGTNYHGYQKQGSLLTVEKVIEDSLERITKTNIKTISSGRTDRGVHALRQVFSFSYEGKMKENDFLRALNSILPEDIRIKSIEKMAEEFHARYSAHKKEYRYYISFNEYNQFYRNLVLYSDYFDIEEVNKAIKDLIGTHDFRGFSKSVLEKNTIKTIYEAEIIKEKENVYCFRFLGNGFLKYMVRSMVGTLIAIGKGQKSKEVIKEILETQNRALAGKTIEAHGLYLWKVYY